MENKALKNILTRHSVREFTGDRVKKEDLLTILKAAMSSPSAVNQQPWSFVVVTKRKILDALCEKLPFAKMLSKAGAAIVVCGLSDKSKLINKDFWVQDCSAASENILLAAHALGYGAVWTAVFPDEKKVKDVRKILRIPKGIIPLNVIPIGRPVNKKEPPKDKFKKNNIHWEKW
jgi:nitroreductase